ncbi:MAG: rRNA maturation RNase YbeY [Pseudomonadota bacterium]
MGLQNPEVSILLLDDEQITSLNKKYLNRSGPTDVISFPIHDNFFGYIQPQLLGDVVISIDTALRQAHKRGIALQAELTALLIHGILHLLGYDHEGSPDESKKMQTKEKELYKILHKNSKKTKKA